MTNKTAGLENWHKSRLGLLVFGVVELGLSYGFGSRAIDTGSWWEYFFMFVFLIGGLQNIVRLVGTIFHATDKTTKA